MLDKRRQLVLEVSSFPMVAVVSIKGGCGRSLTAGYLAIELTQRFPGVTIYLIDFDMGTPGQSALFDLTEAAAQRLLDLDLKTRMATAIREQDWDEVLGSSLQLHKKDRIGGSLRKVLGPSMRGRMHLVSGNGLCPVWSSTLLELLWRIEGAALQAGMRRRLSAPFSRKSSAPRPGSPSLQH